MSIPDPRTLAGRPLRADPSPASRGPLGAPTLPGGVRSPSRPLLEVVPQRHRPLAGYRARRRILAAAGMVGALATVFGLVLVHVQLTTNQMRLSSLQGRAAGAEQRNLDLRLRIAELEAPTRIAATAQRLGMVAPPSITYLAATPGVEGVGAVAPASGPAAATRGWAITKRANPGP